MKRKSTYDYSFETPCDPSKISQHLLQAIGKAIILWNDIEHMIDGALVRATELPPDLYRHVSSRINGVEGKIEIIKASLGNEARFYGYEVPLLLETMGVLMAYKGARDAIAHVRLSNVEGGIMPTFDRKGDQFEVLVTEDSIDRLCEHLVLVRTELAHLVSVLGIVEMRREALQGSEDVPLQLPFAPEFQQVMLQLRLCQTKRRSLLPLLKLPEAPPTGGKLAKTRRKK